jgi:hypothetical protein
MSSNWQHSPALLSTPPRAGVSTRPCGALSHCIKIAFNKRDAASSWFEKPMRIRKYGSRFTLRTEGNLQQAVQTPATAETAGKGLQAAMSSQG